VCFLCGKKWKFTSDTGYYYSQNAVPSVKRLVACSLNSEIRVLIFGYAVRNVGGQRGNSTGFSPSTWVSPLLIISPMSYIHLHFQSAFIRKTTPLKPKTLQIKQYSSGNQKFCTEKHFNFFFQLSRC
jgi:hypothetical protein